MKPLRLAALLAFLGLSASCATTYDAYGSPRQSVDPGVALMGVAAAGLIGYAIASSDSDRDYDNSSYGSGRYSRHQSNNHYRSNSYGGDREYYGGGYSHGYSDCY